MLQYVSFASTYTSLPFVLTVEENLVTFLQGFTESRMEMKRAAHLLERFGIADKKKERVSSLSAAATSVLCS